MVTVVSVCCVSVRSIIGGLAISCAARFATESSATSSVVLSDSEAAFAPSVVLSC